MSRTPMDRAYWTALARRSLGGLLIVALTLVAASAPAALTTPQVYRAATLWTGDGPPINDAALVVRAGTIVAVGPWSEVEIPDDAEIQDLGRSVLIPGLVVAETFLAEGGRDDDQTITPEVRAIDGFDPFDDFHSALSGGVTTVQISPGRGRLIPGQGAVVKLAGEDLDARILNAEEGLRVVLGGPALNPPTIYEPPAAPVSVDRPVTPTSPQLASSLGGAVAGLRAIFRAAEAYADQPESARETDLVLAPIADLLAREGRLRVTTPEPAAVRAALAMAEEFDLRLLLVDPPDLRPFLDRLDSWSPTVQGVVLNPGLRPGRIANPSVPNRDDPEPRSPWDDARALLDAGQTVALKPATDADLNELLFLAGLFTSGGLSEAQVLRMLTAAPAELLGVADRVGTLAEGKDADFVVLTANPFDLHSRVLNVYVNGQRAYSADQEKKVTVIRAKALHTGNGEQIPEASIVVEGGKIRGLGRDVSAPPDAEVRVFESAVIVPGFLDLHTDLGLGGPLRATPPSPSVSDLADLIRSGGPPEEPDSSSSGQQSTRVALEAKLGDRLVSDDPAVAIARQGGVTTVLTGPKGNEPGPIVAFKLGETPTVLGDPVALRFPLVGNLTSATANFKRTLERGKGYAESWTKYEADLKEYEAKKKEYEAAKAKLEADRKAAEAEARKQAEEAKPESESEDESESEGEDEGDESEESDSTEPDDEKDEAEEPKDADDKDKLPEEPTAPKEPNKVAALEPYRDLFGGKLPALVEVQWVDEIRAAVDLFRDEFDLRTILVGADDAFRVADLLAEKDVAVAVGPNLVRTVDREPVNLAQILANRQVPFAFQSEATTGVKLLPQAVQYAVRQGLGTEDALAGLTVHPSTFLGIDDRIGTLSVGKDADLVILSGPPFALSSRVLAVMIDGNWVYQVEDDR